MFFIIIIALILTAAVGTIVYNNYYKKSSVNIPLKTVSFKLSDTGLNYFYTIDQPEIYYKIGDINISGILKKINTTITVKQILSNTDANVCVPTYSFLLKRNNQYINLTDALAPYHRVQSLYREEIRNIDINNIEIYNGDEIYLKIIRPERYCYLIIDNTGNIELSLF